MIFLPIKLRVTATSDCSNVKYCFPTRNRFTAAVGLRNVAWCKFSPLRRSVSLFMRPSIYFSFIYYLFIHLFYHYFIHLLLFMYFFFDFFVCLICLFVCLLACLSLFVHIKDNWSFSMHTRHCHYVCVAQIFMISESNIAMIWRS